MEYKPTNKEQPNYLDLENGMPNGMSNAGVNAGGTGDVHLASDWAPDLGSELPPEVRAAFIKKIYCLLSVQLVITWMMSYGCYASHSATQFVLHTPGALVVAILGTFLSLFLSWCYGRSYPTNYIILFIIAIC